MYLSSAVDGWVCVIYGMLGMCLVELVFDFHNPEEIRGEGREDSQVRDVEEEKEER